MSFKVENNALKFGSSAISFQRTLRIPEDGKTYPLPPSFGFFPVHKIDDYIDKVPEEWKKHGGVFMPMYQREAMWIQFDGKQNEPKACKIAIGKVNAITGKPWNQKIVKGEQQDYVVIPDQPWLDGINAGDGVIKQFVAMPLGGGYTVEAQVTGKEDIGGLQLIVYNPKNKPQPIPQPIVQPIPQPHPVYQPTIPPNYPPYYPPAPNAPPAVQPFMMMAASAQQTLSAPFAFDMSAPMKESATVPNFAPIGGSSSGFSAFNYQNSAPTMQKPAAPMQRSSSSSGSAAPRRALIAPAPAPAPPAPVRQEIEAKEMGLSAGGTMKQSIYNDKYGADNWDENNYARIFVHIVNSKMYEQITGKKPPATPIDASAYTNFGYPWYDIYDEGVPSVEASGILSQVKSVSEIDKQKYGFAKDNNQTVTIPASQVHTVMKKDAVRDGDW